MIKVLCVLLPMSFLLSTGPSLAAGSTSSDACDVAVSEFNAVRFGSDLEQTALKYEALGQAGCAEQVLYCAGNSIALAYVAQGYARADAGADPESIRRLLVAGKSFGAPWQLLVGLADLTSAQARATQDGALMTEAAVYYQDALNTISEPPICSDESGLPSTAEIASIHKRMTESLLLAPQLQIVRTRAGGCGGIFLQSVRGFTPTFRPLPINFEFDKAEFTPAGRDAAEQLLKCLLEEHSDKVILSGHTDAKGSDEYNLALSKRRLASVEEFLVAGGFTGQLVLVPKGESEPFEADDPTQYTEEELDQLNRRVAIRDTTD